MERISIIQRSNLCVISLEAVTGDPMYIETTIIDGQGIRWGIWVRNNSQNITIRGFSFTNCRGAGLSVSESTTSITNCYIYGNSGTNGTGMGISYGTTHLSGVKIYDNYAYNMGGGMFIYGCVGAVNVTFDPVNRCSIYTTGLVPGKTSGLIP